MSILSLNLLFTDEKRKLLKQNKNSEIGTAVIKTHTQIMETETEIGYTEPETKTEIRSTETKIKSTEIICRFMVK